MSNPDADDVDEWILWQMEAIAPHEVELLAAARLIGVGAALALRWPAAELRTGLREKIEEEAAGREAARDPPSRDADE